MQSAQQSTPITVRLDRVRWSCWARYESKVPQITGFRVASDFRINAADGAGVYERVRKLKSEDCDAKADWEYRRKTKWVRPQRVTLIADDKLGLTPTQVYEFFRRCHWGRLLIVEIAVDFAPDTGVDYAFVRRHGAFGKSRRRRDLEHRGELRYGDRKANKFVRVYDKEEVGAFRVELEIHSGLLRKLGIKKLQELGDTAFEIFPKHIRFVQFRWKVLRRYLTRRFGALQGGTIFETTRRKAKSLHAAMRFLRKKGVHNPHRFVRSMRINEAVEEALIEWGIDFSDELADIGSSEPD